VPTPNKYRPNGQQVSRFELYNLEAKVKKTAKTVYLEIPTESTVLELHFGDPVQMMNFMVLMIEEMSKVFPDFEASKLWLDDNFK
jgi:hypothetical protein